MLIPSLLHLKTLEDGANLHTGLPKCFTNMVNTTYNTVSPKVIYQLDPTHKGRGCEMIGSFSIRGGRWEKVRGGDHRSGTARDKT